MGPITDQLRRVKLDILILVKRYLYLEYVNFFESTKRNRVTIYNRWGDLVFEVEDYDNVTRVFRGVSNSGQELPSGTYFYRITFASSEPKREGYLSIRR